MENLASTSNSLLEYGSTYNLGVAISAFAIVVAFIEIISSRNTLRIRIHHKKKLFALFLGFLSIFFSLIAEFVKSSFIFNILGAISMIVSIAIFIWLVLPMKKIKEKEVKELKKILDGFLPNKYAHGNSEIIKDIISIFEDLLKMSLKDKETAELFNRYFTSKVFLNYFSQSGYVFSKTLDFLLKNDLREVQYFFNQLFLTSLNNQNSYLNIFIKEDIYPNTMDNFDMALLDNHNIAGLLNSLKFDIGYSLNSRGQISFLEIVRRYFELINNFNECTKYPKKENCKIKYQLNDELVDFFFNSIKEILGSLYRANEQEQKDILSMVNSFLHSYNHCIDFSQKSEVVRKKAGFFLYDLYEEMLLHCNLYDKKKDIKFGYSVDEFYRNITNYGSDKIAQTIFLEKLKNKIISDELSPNIKGWYPAMLLIYWQLFGFSVFSGNTAMNEPKEINIEILSELSESFPKLYDGHIRNFYNAKLPKGKEKLLKNQGRKILNDFLLEYITYNRKENSLSYIFEFGHSIDGKKIFLDNVKKDKKIETIDI